jgi:DNA-directed RNA polymerase specialized sigma24 family protein
MDFDEFVDEVEPRLRRALTARYGLDRGREATAEALAWAWEHRDRLDTLHSPLSYLYRVGQSKTRARRMIGGLFRSEATWMVTGEPRLLDCLRQLSERQRVCVVLIHGYGWTFAEVADLLGVEIPTVQTHMNRGLSRLRTELGVSDHE